MNCKYAPFTYYDVSTNPETIFTPRYILRDLSIAHRIDACYDAYVKVYTGTVMRIELGQDGGRRAEIACPQELVPSPGQYVQAYKKGDETAAVPISLFLGGWPGKDASLFTTAPPIPMEWQPGDDLILRGPLGNGFSIPPNAKRIGLVALSDTTARLLPLAEMSIHRGAEVALFTDSPLPRLSSQVEANPLHSLPDAISWSDYLAFDGTPGDYENIGKTLGLSPATPLLCPTQILVYLPMPCGGLGECGVCAVPGKGKKHKLACVDGPVFAWGEVFSSV